jgi:DNA (cytosine-5)-methyltransferase 1
VRSPTLRVATRHVCESFRRRLATRSDRADRYGGSPPCQRLSSVGLSDLTAISLFSGAGGLDLGCEDAGFRTRAIVELEARARETITHNAARFFPALDTDQELGAMFKDIADTPPELLLERAGLRKGEAALLHGGPPCVAFSKTGYWLPFKREDKDPKATLVDWFAGMAAQVQPKAVLMENVYGLIYKRSRHHLDRFLAMMDDAGYEMRFEVLLAADYGVPQIRQRLLCVGLRRDLFSADPGLWKFVWPEQSNAGPHETRKLWRQDLPPHKSAGAALQGLTDEQNPAEPEEVVRGTFAEEFRAIPPGDNYLFWTAKRGHPEPRWEWRSRYWSFLLKASPDEPSPTIQGQPGPWVGPFHWEGRRFRTAELKRLMTFPDRFDVLGNRRERQLQLGNAVPPLLAAQVAASIRRALEAIGAIDAVPLAVAA